MSASVTPRPWSQVGELVDEVERLRAERDALRAAIESHRERTKAAVGYVAPIDRDLYAVLREVSGD